MSSYDVMVIGGGLIGTAIACFVSSHFRTALIEQEPQLGYHASGRSAAILLPPYGGPLARSLTAASIDFLKRPPGAFADSGFPSPRGALFIAQQHELPLLEQWTASLSGRPS